MPQSTVSEDVKRLLAEHIESYEELEALLCLWGTTARAWTIDDLAQALKISAESAAAAVTRLVEQKLITRRPADVPTFACASGQDELHRTIQRLAKAYEEERLAVIQLMNANAIERVRTAAMRTFADAFLVGGKKNNG
jgi:hypothetical protein